MPAAKNRSPSILTASDSADVVLARPTKEFFVSMLVRDIELLPAVVDLVDNSVDGARRHREGDYKGLWVRIEADLQRFRIDDNCGGIPLNVARRYAFRFGREAGVERDRHSIGQFGVGMKRALFKLGTHFTVLSRTTRDSFRLEVDVTDWLTTPDNWDFRLAEHQDAERRPVNQAGTEICVDRLHEDVGETFAHKAWEAELAAELRLKHRDALSRGLGIELNGKPIEATRLDLIDDEPFRPGQRLLRVGRNSSSVDIRLLTGLSNSEPDAGGW